MDDLTRRRRFLAYLAAGGSAALAGCPGDQGDGSTSTATDRATASETDSPTATASPTEPVVFTDTPTAATPEGTVFDGGDLDAFVEAVHAAADGSGLLVVDEGEYRFDSLLGERPGSNPHAEIEGVEDVTVEGNGARFVFTVPWRGGLRFAHGSGITLRDLTLDYDPVPFTQGTIVDLSASRRSITVELDEGFPALDHEMFDRVGKVWASVHRSDGRFVRSIKKQRDPRKHFTTVTRLDDRRYRLGLTMQSSTLGLAEGRKLVVVARNDETMLAFHKVADPVLERVTVRATTGAAFATTVCAAPTVRDCTVAPPPDSSRHIGAVADAVRIVNCPGGATVEDCRTRAVEDDGVVVQRNLTRVLEVVDDRTVRVEKVYPFVVGPGDTLEVLAADGTTHGTLPAVAEVGKRFPDEPGDRFDPETITFGEPVADTLTEGMYLGNRATRCAGFAVRDNDLRNHRANLVRATTGPGVIEDNVLEGASWNCIEFEATTGGHFGPRGWVRDVTVRDNEVRRPGLNYIALPDPAGVKVHYRSPEDVPTRGRPHTGIAVVDNAVETCAGLGMLLQDVAGIRVEGNAVRDVNRLDYPYGGYGVGLVNVDDLTLRGNQVTGMTAQLDGFGWAKESGAVSLAGNRMLVDGAEVPVELERWRRVALAFDRTVVPEGGDLRLAVRCYALRLVDGAGDVVRRIDVGGTEEGVRFDAGVYAPEQEGGDSWRWFGTVRPTTVMYLRAKDLAAATTLELRGKAIEDGISAVVRVDGTRTDEATFEDGPVQGYRLSLDGPG